MPTLDSRLLDTLTPHAQQLAMSMQSVSGSERRLRRRAVRESLWRAAYAQGLTTYALPPLLVAIFWRALWAVVCHLAEQVLIAQDS